MFIFVYMFNLVDMIILVDIFFRVIIFFALHDARRGRLFLHHPLR